MNKLKKIRQVINFYKLDGYIIPKNDEFFGEYIHASKDRLKFISSFSGSAGIGLIMQNQAFIFVDGRYTLQAKRECNSRFKIVEIHKKKPKKLFSKIKNKINIGFDSKLHTTLSLKTLFKSKKINLIPFENNLIDKIWKNKPKQSLKKFYILNNKNTGENYKNKVRKVIKLMKKISVNKLLITAPENIAWLMNIRGNDSNFSPIPNCNAVLYTNERIDLIVDKKKIDKKFKIFFGEKLNFVSPEKIFEYFAKLESNKSRFLLDILTCSHFYKTLIKKNGFNFIEKLDPIYSLKALKNRTEINNMKISHKYDGIALTKFIYWVKNNYLKLNLTEMSVQNKLESFRKKSKYYKFPSFNTISGTGPNGAIVHYRATPDTNRKLKKGHLYLVDSGGQYFYGTTDVTRTIPLGTQSEKIKDVYTRVLKGHISVIKFKINNSTTGKKIDIAARKPLKSIGLNYEHGTGHGVGFFLNVHEGPQAISPNNNIRLKEGMILSNEPGYYEKNKFGIRIENLIYIKKNEDNKLIFENLTYAPIDLDMVKFDMLTQNEKEYINKYNNEVLKKIGPHLNEKERNWLKFNN